MPQPLRPTRRHYGDAARQIVCVAMLLLAAGQTSHAARMCADEGCVTVRPQDQVFVISSRPVGCSTDPTRLETGLHAEEFAPANETGERVWRKIDWRSVVAPHDAATPTIFYTHGNRIAWCETRRRGLYMYKRLLRCACDDRPIRYVIWSWCADEVKGPLKDYRTKAARTGPVGRQLAWVVNQMPADETLGFLGYSYGARVTSGALHELGNGRLEGPPRSVRAFYIAAAQDAQWLGHGQRHGCAMEITEKLMVVTNRKDPAMRFYGLLPRGYKPKALGFSGPTCLNSEQASKVRLMNVASCVGRTHDLCEYVKAPGMMAKAWRMLSYADRVETAAPTLPPAPVLAPDGA